MSSKISWKSRLSAKFWGICGYSKNRNWAIARGSVYWFDRKQSTVMLIRSGSLICGEFC